MGATAISAPDSTQAHHFHIFVTLPEVKRRYLILFETELVEVDGPCMNIASAQIADAQPDISYVVEQGLPHNPVGRDAAACEACARQEQGLATRRAHNSERYCMIYYIVTHSTLTQYAQWVNTCDGACVDVHVLLQLTASFPQG